jgi:hypothetical protein
LSLQNGKWRLIDRKKTVTIYLLFLFGVIISLGLFSAVGYSVWGLGGRGRTLIIFSFYFVIIFGIIINILSRKSHKIFKFVKLVSIGFIILFGWNSIRNSLDWATSWDIQKKNIKNITIEQLQKTGKNDLILINTQFRNNWVSVFDAQWAIYPQLNYGRLMLGKFAGKSADIDTSLYRKFIIGKNIIHPVKNTPYINYWDGCKLYQYYEEVNSKTGLGDGFYSKQLSYEGENLWLWNFYSNKLVKIKKVGSIRFEPQKNYDYWITQLYYHFK